MVFTRTRIPGAFLIEIEKRSDARGFFARAWCENEFHEHGIDVQFVQANIGFSEHAGTVRGLHYQLAPHEETKLIRCTRGAVFDVIVDLRTTSPGYKQWYGVELSEQNHRMLYVPGGCAHGYQTLTESAEVFYPVSTFFKPEAERGIRYDDPTFNIEWPIHVRVISEKDRAWTDYSE